MHKPQGFNSVPPIFDCALHVYANILAANAFPRPLNAIERDDEPESAVGPASRVAQKRGFAGPQDAGNQEDQGERGRPRGQWKMRPYDPHPVCSFHAVLPDDRYSFAKCNGHGVALSPETTS